MRYMGPVRVSDVEAAQQRIVDIVRRLESQGAGHRGRGSDGEAAVCCGQGEVPMALIRQADIESNPRRALVLNVENIRAQADAIIDRTREAAAAIIAEAHAERARIVAGAAEAGRAQGHAEGLAAGLEVGRELGRAEAFERAGAGLAALEASLRAALEGFGVEREALLRACESQAPAGALLAERVTLRARDESGVGGAAGGIASRDGDPAQPPCALGASGG